MNYTISAIVRALRIYGNIDRLDGYRNLLGDTLVNISKKRLYIVDMLDYTAIGVKTTIIIKTAIFISIFARNCQVSALLIAVSAKVIAIVSLNPLKLNTLKPYGDGV